MIECIRQYFTYGLNENDVMRIQFICKIILYLIFVVVVMEGRWLITFYNCQNHSTLSNFRNIDFGWFSASEPKEFDFGG